MNDIHDTMSTQPLLYRHFLAENPTLSPKKTGWLYCTVMQYNYNAMIKLVIGLIHHKLVWSQQSRHLSKNTVLSV